MKQPIPTLLIRLLLVVGLPVCAHGEADAATWQWTRESGRERIAIMPDAPVARAVTRRTGEQDLTITLTPPPQDLERQGAGPVPQALLSALSLRDGELILHTSSPAFGFIAGRPTATGVEIILYSDPLGLRWRPGGGLGPVPPAVVSAPPRGEAPAASSPLSPASTPPVSAPSPAVGVPATADTPPVGGGQSMIPPPGAASPVTPEEISTPAAPAPPSSSPFSAATAPQAALPAAKTTSAPEFSPADAPAEAPAHPVASPDGEAALPESGPIPPASVPPSSTAALPPAPSAPEQGVSEMDVRGDAPVVRESPLPAPATDEGAFPSLPEFAAPLETVPAPDTGSPSPAREPEPSSAFPAPPVASTPASVPAAPVEPAAVVPVVRGRLNRGGPEAWPEEQALSSAHPAPVATLPSSVPAAPGAVDVPPVETVSPPASPSPAASATEESAPEAPSPEKLPTDTPPQADELPALSGSLDAQPEHLEDAAPAETRVEKAAEDKVPEETVAPAPIYVDEEGNPVPPPPDVPALLSAMRAAMKEGRYQDALASMTELRQAQLSREEREEMLYNAMTALYESSRQNFAPRAQDIIDAANAAMNFNLDSPRVPDALGVLAAINLALDNVEDARGYVQLMRRKYPQSGNVPASLLDLGGKQMERQEYAEAALSFQTILQEYPDSKMAKDAARLETYALYRQGHTDRALTLVDFVDRRWPRVYLEDPDYLAISADIRFKQGHLEDALHTYWTQYNLEPAKPEAASILQRIAETYYLLSDPNAAAKVLDELIRAFPLSAEAPIALLRLGENGIHEGNPTVDELFAVFEAPNPRLPGLYYQRILQDYPQSPEAMTAQLRTTVWQLWNKEYLPAMSAARSFLIDYADKPESLRARTVLLRGFAHELALSLQEENYERVLRLWEDFPQAHDEYLPLEPDVRMALARAHLNRGQQQEGLDLLSPFLDGPGDTDDALYAYNLFLATYLREQNWDAILSLSEKVAAWKLPEEARRQLDYAQALSAENLGLQGRALPLWQKLAGRTDIPLYQRAYATYFLARDAETRQDLREAYQYNLDTLGMFTQLQDEQSPYADEERVRESIAALMDVTEIAGRYAEALEWANRYALFVPESSPDYAGLQFREAGLHRKMGDMARWRALLQGIVDREPDSVFGQMAASELRTQDVARDLTRFTGN